MFQSISWASLTVVFLGIIIHLCAGLGGNQPKGKSRAKRHPLWWCGWADDLELLGKLKRLAGIVAVVSLLLMALTAFYGRLTADQVMTGYTLMIHVGTAPVFLVCSVFLLVTWSYQCRLSDGEWDELTKRLRFQPVKADGSGLWLKLHFGVRCSSLCQPVCPSWRLCSQSSALIRRKSSSASINTPASVSSCLPSFTFTS